jgi:hypothetical protein
MEGSVRCLLDHETPLELFDIPDRRPGTVIEVEMCSRLDSIELKEHSRFSVVRRKAFHQHATDARQRSDSTGINHWIQEMSIGLLRLKKSGREQPAAYLI